MRNFVMDIKVVFARRVHFRFVSEPTQLKALSYPSKETNRHTDSVEHFDDFRRRKSGQNDDFRGRFYAVAEFASLGAENGYCLTIFGAENRAKMTILGTNR